MKITNPEIKTLLEALMDHGYLYLARDPDDGSLFAYRALPHLEDGCYTLSDKDMERGYSCLLLAARSIEMFIDDHDICALYHADPKALARIPVDAREKPILIDTLV